jgi:hypothetical protein
MDTESTKYEPILQQMAPGFFCTHKGAPWNLDANRRQRTGFGVAQLTKEEIATRQATTPDERRGESALGSDERLPRPTPSARTAPRLLFSASPAPALRREGRRRTGRIVRGGGRRKWPHNRFLYLAGFEHETDRIPTFYIFRGFIHVVLTRVIICI